MTDIAARCGFAHLGRFSAEYRRRYGENPSRTLTRRETALPTPRLFFATTSHDGSSIAVVPVDAPAGEEQIARGVAEEIAVALARSGLAVTTRPGTARYHVLTGFRGDARHARLTIRLIEAATGRYVWAHHADGASIENFLFEDRIAAGIAAAVQSALRTAEIARAIETPDTDLGGYQLTLRAMAQATAIEAEAGSRALGLLDRALGLDPDNALALALAAWCHGQRVVYQFTEFQPRRPGWRSASPTGPSRSVATRPCWPFSATPIRRFTSSKRPISSSTRR